MKVFFLIMERVYSLW